MPAECVTARERECGSRSGTHAACVSMTAREGNASLDLELASKRDCGRDATGPRKCDAQSRLAKQAATAARRESGEWRYVEQLGLAAFIWDFCAGLQWVVNKNVGCWLPALGVTGMVGLWVWVAYFLTCQLISVGFGDVPVSVPEGRLIHLYPCPAGLLPVGMQIFCTCCHLYS